VYIGQSLHRVLQANNYTVSHFAEVLGMTRSQLYKILQDEHSPTLTTLERIGSALDLSVGEFMSLIEELNREFR
jgi:transcriptional regulator with XRE-family HTH domain